MNKIIFAVDPSIRSLGWAVIMPGVGTVLEAGYIKNKSKDNDDYAARAVAMGILTRSTLYTACSRSRGPRADVIVEQPAAWLSAKGLASMHSESIQRLYYFVGALCGLLIDCDVVDSIWCIPASKWKGQTPKDVITRRVARRLEAQGKKLPKKTPDDTVEAIQLGAYASKHIEKVGSSWAYNNHTLVFSRRAILGGQIEVNSCLENATPSPCRP